MTRLRADLLLLIAAALWGVAFVFQKDAMAHVGAWTFIAARAALAVLILVPLAVLEHRRHAGPAPTGLHRIALAGGLAFLVAAFLQQEGLKTTSVTSTSFLTALYVVFTPLAAWLLSRIVPPTVVWPAIGLSFVGTWLLGGGTFGGLGAGEAMVMGSALFWATHCVVTAKASAFNRPIAYTALQFSVVASGAALAGGLFETPTLAGLRAAAVPIVYVGMVSTALTFTLLVIALRHTTPPEAAVLLSTESLFAAAAGAVLLGERLSQVAWIGAILIVASILLVQLGPRLRRQGSPGAE